jgi:hypothetical protein
LNVRSLYRAGSLATAVRELAITNVNAPMVTDSHSILARWRNHFAQLFNVHGINDIRQTEIHTAEPLVPQLNAFEFGLAIEKLKSHNSPGTDQIPAELIKAGGRTIHSEIHKLICSYLLYLIIIVYGIVKNTTLHRGVGYSNMFRLYSHLQADFRTL